MVFFKQLSGFIIWSDIKNGKKFSGKSLKLIWLLLKVKKHQDWYLGRKKIYWKY